MYVTLNVTLSVFLVKKNFNIGMSAQCVCVLIVRYLDERIMLIMKIAKMRKVLK